MASLTFPLPVSATADLPTRQSLPVLGYDGSTTRTRGGQPLSARFGDRLWRMALTMPSGYHAAHRRWQALLSLLEQPGASLLMPVRPYTGPALDPGGAALGASSPNLHTISADRREIRISGLPAGYTISAGDFLSFTYSSSPTRYALHHVRPSRSCRPCTRPQPPPPPSSWSRLTRNSSSRPRCRSARMIRSSPRGTFLTWCKA